MLPDFQTALRAFNIRGELAVALEWRKLTICLLLLAFLGQS